MAVCPTNRAQLADANLLGSRHNPMYLILRNRRVLIGIWHIVAADASMHMMFSITIDSQCFGPRNITRPAYFDTSNETWLEPCDKTGLVDSWIKVYLPDLDS